MIETPALFPSMTAYQNMEVQRIQRGIPDKSVIKRTLDMVELQDTGKKSVRNSCNLALFFLILRKSSRAIRFLMFGRLSICVIFVGWNVQAES